MRSTATSQRYVRKRRFRIVPIAVLAAVLAPLAPVGSAQAVPWTWSASRVVEPSGGGCGEHLLEVVDARSGARNLRATTRLQTPLFDSVEGLIVARVTGVEMVRDAGAGIPGLAFALTGSDDVCDNPADYPNGWTAEPVRLRITYTRNEPVYFKEFQHAGNRYARKRPRSIHGGSDFGWARIRWSSWGDRVARGRGVFYYVDKTVVPYRTILFPMRFRLSNPQPCYGRLRYLHMETVRTTRTPHLSWVKHRQAKALSCENGIYE